MLTIISYGALLLLLTPPTGMGLVLTIMIFIFGVILEIKMKVFIRADRQKTSYLLIPVSLLIAASLGSFFYLHWFPSSKVQFIANSVHLQTETLLLIVSSVLAALSLYFIYSGLQKLTEKLFDSKQHNKLAENILCCVIASVITVALSQDMINAGLISVGFPDLLFGISVVLVIILTLYCLFGKIEFSVAIGSGIFMIISTINVYIYRFRGRMFEPLDILSADTAINVVENYSLFPIPQSILSGWGIYVAMLVIVLCFGRNIGQRFNIRKRLALLVICAAGSFMILLYSTTLEAYHWDLEGAQFNGYILDFVSQFKNITEPVPENYSTDLVEQLAKQYAADNNQDLPDEPTNIIVIMDEAFSDLSLIGDLSANEDVMPFISSLKENTISGYTLTSVFGGNTANSEYEFLTGNSLACLSPNTVPYSQYIRSSSYSMVSNLKSKFNYKCIAMHPFYSNGWNRASVYEHLGFDECDFIEEFPQKDFVRKYISDQEMFEYLINTYESQKDKPLFIFGVTMQDHGSYTYTGENFTNTISLRNYPNEFPEAEQYLSLIHETDKAVEYLINYFKNEDENVVVVFFGDHQPKLEDSFYKTIRGTTTNTLDEKQTLYKVPFFIWANYDLEEEYLPCTSLNYLSSYVYTAAGITLPPYNRFRKEMEKIIPSINAYGFYSLRSGRYLPLEDADGEELKWLELYKTLQYNNMFDEKNRNESFFPLAS